MGRHEVEDRVNLIFENGDVMRFRDVNRNRALWCQRLSSKMLWLCWRAESHKCGELLRSGRGSSSE